MTPRIFLLLSLLTAAAPADTLKPADKEALLQRLEKLNEAAESKIDGRFKVATAAFRAALASDKATVELYLKCVEKVEYTDAGKKDQDFREWKRKENGTLENPGFHAALHHQLVWLLLTMEAGATKGRPASINSKMDSSVEAVFADADKLRDFHDLLGRSVLDSVFARTYDLASLKLEDWPTSPVDIGAIFKQHLIAQCRLTGKIPELRAEWMKYIKDEGIAAEKWSAKPTDFEKWQTEKYPELLWDMEVDAYKAGDQSVAAAHMVAHIEKYITHPKAPLWAKQVKGLVNGEIDKSDRSGATPAISPTPAATDASGADATAKP